MGAATAIEHLESSVEKDVLDRPWMTTKRELIELLDVPPPQAEPLNVGITYSRMLRWVPTATTMLSREWLAEMEARGTYYDSIGSVSPVKFAVDVQNVLHLVGLA